MKTNEEGFTLLETLLVLLITGSLLLFPVIQLENTIETLQIDLFFRELTSKITQMHTHAIMYGQGTEVKIVPGNRTISFLIFDENVEDSVLNQVWEIDSPYYEIANKGSSHFIFKKDSGNITKSNKAVFDTSQGRYELVYLMGSGRFDIRKSERQ